ncbi:signal transduction histidine kinase [Catenulispora sp. EB89]|uniref:HAMP domain-containing sensor histidine kinase n=1 Tax=Catenulispora sp. EB89 TaxID=3156257 RepID=UPI0035147B90
MTARGKGGGADVTQGSGADVANTGTTAGTTAGSTAAATAKPVAFRGRLPFRRRMDLLVVLPTVAMAALMTPVAVHEVNVAGQWNSAADFLSSSKSVSQLIQDLSLERDKAQAAMSGDPDKDREYQSAIAATDAQVDQVTRDFGQTATPTLKAALAAVSDLSYVRELPASEGMSQNYVLQAHVQQLVDTVYGAIDSQMVSALDFGGHAAAGGPAASLESELSALYSGDMAESQREASLTAFASGPTEYNAGEQYATALRWDQVAQVQFGLVQQSTAASDRDAIAALLDSTQAQVFRNYQGKAEALYGQAFDPVRGVNGNTQVNLQDIQTLSDRTSLTAAFETASNQREAAEAQITDRIIGLARDNARQAEFTVGLLIGVGVLAAGALMVLSALIRRSVVQPVVALTAAATRVARAAAADLERVTDEDLGANGELPDFEAIPVPTDDELGDLALAFNKVQETALLMLERQVTIRRNTAEMFGNVGHRIHNLTGRQLSIIDQVERTETDPVLLDRLYRIDHLAVRLQRGADSLILLSGEREANISGSPMRLTDVVRSAVGRVEGYQRVVLIAEDDAMVAPSAVGDMTLMVAELVENAVSFSPASQRVEIAVGLSARGFVIEIVDRGMGMSPEQMAQENARLVRRERLDLAPTRVLGLFVVGRLSVRTGAAVELSPTTGGGTTARVYVPGFLLAGPVTESASTRAPRGDAAEAAATGVPAAAPAPPANGVPALPSSPAQAHAQALEMRGRPPLTPAQPLHAPPPSRPRANPGPAAALPPGAEGLPRRVPGASQPGEAFSLPTPTSEFDAYATPGSAAGSPAAPTAPTVPFGPAGYAADQAGPYAAPSYQPAPVDSAEAAAAAAAAAEGAAGFVDGQPGEFGQNSQPGQPGQPSFQRFERPANPAEGQSKSPSFQQFDRTPNAAEGQYAPPSPAPAASPSPAPSYQPIQPQAPAGHQPHQPPAAGPDGSSLQASGLDALGRPGAPDAPGARYSLGPLAPVPPEGLGRRRALAGGETQHLPHQPVPEPRRETGMLPVRRPPTVPAPPPAPAPEAPGMVPPHQPAPEPPRFAAGSAPAAPAAPPGAVTPPSATTPQPADGALPRRVRKTPSHPDWPTSQMPVVGADGPAQPQDARAVRDALEEFEAGVERANRDSADQIPTRRQAARHAGPTTPERDGEDQ